MNERIKLLALEAGGVLQTGVKSGVAGTFILDTGAFDAVKFAELIIDQCAGIAHGSDTPSGDIMEHFGLGPKTPDAMPCVVCDRALDMISVGQPAGGLGVTTHGHYGSAVFDPMDGSTLTFVICDACLEKKVIK